MMDIRLIFLNSAVVDQDMQGVTQERKSSRLLDGGLSA